jgi:hypothetical protein
MSDEQRHSEDQGKEEERDETMQDLDVSQEDSENVRGGLLREGERAKK